MSWDDTPEGTGPQRECACGEMCKLIPTPLFINEMTGIHHLWIHIHNCDTRCYPNSDNEIDSKAMVCFP